LNNRRDDKNRRKFRDNKPQKEDKNFISGKNPVREALEAGIVEKAHTCDKNYFDELKRAYKNLVYMDRNAFKTRFPDVRDVVVAKIIPFQYSSIEEIINSCKEESVVAILDHIEDPHNFGAIIRTCVCAGVEGIVIPNARSVEVTSVVYKTSAGAVSHIKIAKVPNVSNTIEFLKKNDFWVYGIEASGSESIYGVDYKGKTAVVLGSEGSGISRVVQKNLDYLLNIPMSGKLSSLNVSVATGIFLYEIKRKKEKIGVNAI